MQIYDAKMDGFGRVDDIQIVMIILIIKTTKVLYEVSFMETWESWFSDQTNNSYIFI